MYRCMGVWGLIICSGVVAICSGSVVFSFTFRRVRFIRKVATALNENFGSA